MLAAKHPERVDRLVLCNAEAYDNWPSGDERPFVIAAQLPVLGGLFRLALSSPRAFTRSAPTAGWGQCVHHSPEAERHA